MTEDTKNLLKKIFTAQQIKILKRLWYMYQSRIIAPFCANNLDKLALIYNTDKNGAHYYTQHYQKHFAHLRNRRLNILEIGVGGDADPKAGGASLRMWKRYFPKSKIYSIDIYDKSALQEKRIKIFKGDQTDKNFLNDICKKTGPLDIIIDDGSHINSHVIASFKILFPFLKYGGAYICEDTQTSYWPRLDGGEFGGDSENFNNTNTSMGFFKSLVDGLNYKEFLLSDYEPTDFDKQIASIHFYHNLVFVYKGLNNEESIKARKLTLQL